MSNGTTYFVNSMVATVEFQFERKLHELGLNRLWLRLGVINTCEYDASKYQSQLWLVMDEEMLFYLLS